MELKELHLSIWEALLLQQRKSRFVAQTLLRDPHKGARLNLAEGLILLIVDSEQGRNVRNLSEALGLERSWVSRIISALVEKDFVQTFSAEEDRRNRIVKITRKGKTELSRLTEIRERIITEIFRELTPPEQEQLQDHLKRLADGLNAPAYSTLSRCHPIDAELARISWRIGVIGDNFMNSGMNLTRYQLLFELARKAENYSSASDLALVFPSDSSTVSRTIVSLCEEGLAERKASTTDGRRQLVRMAARGRAAWATLQEKAAAVIGQALKSLQPAELQSFSTLLAKATSEIPERLRTPSARHTEVRALSQQERADLVSRYGLSVTAQPAGGSTQRVSYYGFFENHEPQGVIALEQGGGQDCPRFLLSAQDMNANDVLRFVRSAFKMGLKPQAA